MNFIRFVENSIDLRDIFERVKYVLWAILRNGLK